MNIRRCSLPGISSQPLQNSIKNKKSDSVITNRIQINCKLAFIHIYQNDLNLNELCFYKVKPKNQPE
jgi:hypothetical protein